MGKLDSKNEVRIEDLREANIDDLIYVCSSNRLEDPLHQKGVVLKKNWLLRMLRDHGPFAKIAYLKDKPVSQILFHPEEADPTKRMKRDGAIFLVCVYNPFTEAQRLGIGTMLLQTLITDCSSGLECLGDKPCSFIVTKAFNTGQYLSLPEFYRRRGFEPSPSEPETFYLEITKPYEPSGVAEGYKPLPEDEGKAVVFYSPTCQFSCPFAVRISQTISEIAPDLPIEMISEWEKPEESIKRKNWWLIVNAKPIHTFFMEEDKFKAEVKKAIVTRNQTL